MLPYSGMANMLELKAGELPRGRHALIVSSAKPPPTGAPRMDRESSQIYYVSDNEQEIALTVTRALAWADEREIATVFLRRVR